MTSDRVARTQQLRRSNAAQPIPSGKAYKRRPKHRKQQRD